MNMHNSHPYIKYSSLALIVLLSLSFAGCRKNKNTKDLYNVENFDIGPAYANKFKEKTPEQYVSVLYANLFQKGISSARLAELTDAMYSMGDKLLARELIVSNFMNDTSIVLPTEDFMRGNPGLFLEEAYQRFFIRNITEAEKAWFIQYINKNPDVTVEFIYAAFALSNEYFYY